jgi:hypothetical protein
MAAQVAMRQRANSFRDKLGRYTERDRRDADLLRMAVTALTAEISRVVHAVIKGGTEYRPFFERPVRVEGPLIVRAVRARERPCR